MADNGVYVVSKVPYAGMWRALRREGIPVISSWIDDGLEFEIDFSEAWPRYLREASSARFVIVFSAPGDNPLKGGLVEVGAALASGADVFVVGEVPELRTVKHHPRVHVALSLPHAIARIQEIRGLTQVRSLDAEVADFVGTAFGYDCLMDMKERGKRVYEEACELVQTLGISQGELAAIVDWVFSRPVGDTRQELAGVGMTSLAFAYAYGVRLDDVVREELDRVNKLPLSKFRAKKALKVAAGISERSEIDHLTTETEAADAGI